MTLLHSRAWFSSRSAAAEAARGLADRMRARFAEASELAPEVADGSVAASGRLVCSFEVIDVEPVSPLVGYAGSNPPPTRVVWEVSDPVLGRRARINAMVASTRIPPALAYRTLAGSRIPPTLGPVQASGTSPPGVTLSGTPDEDVTTVRIEVTSISSVGAPFFKWTTDGLTFTTGVAVAPTVALGSTGVTANFTAVSHVAPVVGAVVPSGPLPPTVTISGTAADSVTGVAIDITTGGTRGAALFRWSTDGGTSWGGVGVATAASVTLGSSGLTAAFDVGTYDVDNGYTAPVVPASSNYSIGDTYVSSVTPAYTTPDVTIGGTPSEDVTGLSLQITTAGALGVAWFRYSIDGASSWSPVAVTSASAQLGDTGLTVRFGSGEYAASTVYTTTVAPPYWGGPAIGDVSYQQIGDELQWRTSVRQGENGCWSVELLCG